ncbi:hypothetical protein V1477_004512, partial [Vespula maculifrons]
LYLYARKFTLITIVLCYECTELKSNIAEKTNIDTNALSKYPIIISESHIYPIRSRIRKSHDSTYSISLVLPEIETSINEAVNILQVDLDCNISIRQVLMET